MADRMACTIISAGVTIYPQEVENVLALHPKVLEVGPIGVPDPEMGESVKAFLRAAPGVQADPELEGEVTEFVRSKVAHCKAPWSVEHLGQLPRTPTGKPVKRGLKDLHPRAGTGRP